MHNAPQSTGLLEGLGEQISRYMQLVYVSTLEVDCCGDEMSYRLLEIGAILSAKSVIGCQDGFKADMGTRRVISRSRRHYACDCRRKIDSR